MATIELQSQTAGTPALTREASADVVFVDLDGTLIKTDLLWESCLLALKQCPTAVPRLAVTLLRGKAAFKQALAALVTPDASLLPYNAQVVEELRRERRPVVLATASPGVWAEAVSAHLGIFADVLGSEGTQNLKGTEKLQAMQAWCERHGQTGFAYYGDSKADLPIWAASHEAVAVGPSATVRRGLKAQAKSPRIIEPERGRRFPLLKVLRPHQWAKNVLLLVPLILAHAYQWPTLLSGLLAFAAFSLCASAVYVLNDLLDVEADRRHPKKCRRPFAAGTLPILWGPPLAAGLTLVGIGLSLWLPPVFTATLVGYMILTSLYSFWLKRKLIIDVLMLAGLYTLRIIAGGQATGTEVSEWLMAFSVFLFTSLAFAKRHAELGRLASEGHTRPNGRGYMVEDLGLIESIGPASGYIAVLVMALYINSDRMKHIYANPWALWMICPLLMYWITRLWFVTRRGKLSEDPVIYAIRDRTSQLTGVAVVLLACLASVPFKTWFV